MFGKACPPLSFHDRPSPGKALINLSNTRAMQSSHDDVIVMNLTCCKLSDSFEMDGGESLGPKMAEEGIKMASKKIEEVKKKFGREISNFKKQNWQFLQIM